MQPKHLQRTKILSLMHVVLPSSKMTRTRTCQPKLIGVAAPNSILSPSNPDIIILFHFPNDIVFYNHWQAGTLKRRNNQLNAAVKFRSRQEHKQKKAKTKTTKKMTFRYMCVNP